jgi:hypothetical protein
MKKTIIFIIFLICVAISTYSQAQKNIISVNELYYQKDTTRTFGFIKSLNYDNCIDSLIKFWGTPAKNETGKILWSNIEITGIGKELSVELHDGIYKKLDDGNTIYKPFESKKDKKKKIRKLKSTQWREVEIVFSNKNGLNIIDDKAKTETVKKLLTKIVG